MNDALTEKSPYQSLLKVADTQATKKLHHLVQFSELGKISVIMPCYNEGLSIYKNLLETVDVIQNFAADFEIIAVNDGSSDNTLEQLRAASLFEPRIHIVNCKDNGGKGNALKEGVRKSSGAIIVFCDSDLDLHPSQLDNFFKIMLETDADVVIGSKLHPQSEIEYPFVRKVCSYLYYLGLLLLFNLNVRDTQTGLKVFKAKALKPVMDKVSVKGFAYDIELLTLLNRKKCRIEQAPVKLIFQRQYSWGRIKLKDVIKIFSDTLIVFYRLRILHLYD